ncbi:MAG: hypothetical protein KDC87_07735 [Planctomycetes bacterium]|nr:hypothetical protein [Planctomycetota bacterium]MCB9868766.1 hypothetical protein [Planctomycetota bacterium]
MHKTLLLAVPALAAATLAQDQRKPSDQTRTLQIVPVADLLHHVPLVRPPRLGRLTGLRGSDDEPRSLLARGPFRCLESDQLIELIRTDSRVSDGEADVVRRGTDLLLTGRAAAVAKLERVVDAIRHTLTRQVVIRGRLLRIDDDTEFPAVASPELTAALTAKLPLLWTGSARAMSGQQVVLGQETFSRYTGSVEVEVAEKSRIAAPKSVFAFEGIRLLVENHALVGTTERVLKCQFAIGERRGEVHELPLGVRGFPAIGVPEWNSTTGGCSGRVAPEGALLVTIRGGPAGGSNLLLVVQAEQPGGQSPTEVAIGNTVIFPVSALTGTSLRRACRLANDDEEADGEGARGAYPPISTSDEPEDAGEALAELLRNGLGDELDKSEATIHLLGNGIGTGYLLARGSEQLRTAARRLLTRLQSEWLQNVEVQAITRLHAAPDSPATFTPLDQREPIGRLYGSTVPCLSGHSALVLQGSESSVVRDWEVEIASKSSIASPVIQPTFRGMAMAVQVARRNGALWAEFELLLNHHDTPRRAATGGVDGGFFQHLRAQRSQFRHHGELAHDREQSLGWGSCVRLQSGCARARQTVRFRKL